jgi:hypothetical protein
MNIIKLTKFSIEALSRQDVTLVTAETTINFMNEKLEGCSEIIGKM